ncbi:MAG: hypothetical protein GY758_34045 [Fuerstiella sp.]|jgi:hypothetical protein|nr:hypothetical protein [Fuerstiella sp.]MDG2127694.1 hypothetical protein [Fuerstiella sp.]
MLTLMILAVVGFLLLRRMSSAPRGILHMAGLAAAICVVLTLVSRFEIADRLTRGLAGSGFRVMVDESIVDADLHRVSLATADVTETSTFGSAGRSMTSQLDKGDMLVLPLSQDFVAGLLGTKGADAVAMLNASISPELQQAYALIPLSATAPQTAGPVIRHAFSPSGFRALLSALSHVWQAADGEAQLTAEANTQDNLLTELPEPTEPPEWIDNPGIGQTVVQSKFIEASIPAAEALRAVIVETLKDRVTEKVFADFSAAADWEKVVDLNVTDRAILNSFRKTYTRTEVIDTAGNPTPMRQTYALIEFPEATEEQILSDIESALKKNRVMAVCVALGILWLCAVLLNLALRAGQHGSFLRKLTAVPVMGLLILPCVAAFLAMTSAMANGRTFDFSWSDNRVSCVVDYVEK